MSDAPWLVIDVSFVCRRAFHTLKDLSHEDVKTGVVYGFFLSVVELMEQFMTQKVVFCFDYGKGIRKTMLPEYKRKRHSKELTEEEVAAEEEYRRQVKLLRTDYLKDAGFRNLFFQKGYESDDVIASFTMALSSGESAIIVSADGDLLQLLRPNVSMWNPAKRALVTYSAFRKEYGIHPRVWAHVKAIGGCRTDEVPGVKGVGEKTALKYLLNQLKPESKVYQKIASVEGAAIAKRNLPLVQLPLHGTEQFSADPTFAPSDGWERVCKKLGMESLLHQSPFVSKRRRSTLKRDRR